MDHTLEKFLILNILKKYPGITRYQVTKAMSKLQISIRVATIYSIVKTFYKAGLVKRETSITRQGKYHNGYKRKKDHKKRILYSLTDKGFKELFKLESKIRIALTLTIEGEKI